MANLRRWMLVLLVPAVALVSACSSSSGFNDNSDCDYLINASTSQEGTSLPSLTFVCENEPLSLSFEVTVNFLGPAAEDGGLGEPPDATTLSKFLLEHYDVSYRNLTTGRSVAGVDVPQPIRVTVQGLFDLTEETTLNLQGWPVLNAGAKQQPPLSNSAFFPADGTGVVFEATITFWGRPITSDGNWCYQSLRWVFTVSPC